MKKLLILLFCLTAWLLPAQTNPYLEGTYTGTDGKAYAPLTDAQVQAWLKSVTPEVLFNTIRKLDLIEHVQPIIGFPEAVVGTTKDHSIFLAWTDPGRLTIDVAGQLNYSIKLQAKEFKGLVKHDSPLKLIVTLLLTAATASLSEYVFEQVGLAKTNGGAAVLISIGLGGSVGGLVYGLWPQE